MLRMQTTMNAIHSELLAFMRLSEVGFAKRGSLLKSKKINLPGVGDILIERSDRARHINLSVKPFKGVRIAVPRGVSFDAALAVAREKRQWLKQHLDRMVLIEEQIRTQHTQCIVNRRVAREILVSRLDTLAVRHGFQYNRVFVRNQKTRWGSCSRQNNINLNINLVRLPKRLMDYTILHELVHTRIKNHGPDFWKALAACLANARALDKELNQYWMLLVATERK